MLLAASKVIEIPVFQNFKIVIMIATFFLVNLTMIFLIFFAIAKAAMSVIRSDIGQATNYMSK